MGRRLMLCVVFVVACATSTQAQVHERYRWDADSLGGSCGSQPPGTSCQTSATLSANSADNTYTPLLSGRVGSGIRINSRNKGYHVDMTQNYARSRGFAYSTFVWLNAEPTSAQAIFWQEGPSLTGVAVYVTTGGTVYALAGNSGQPWNCVLRSTRVIGTQAWHHVALAWHSDTLRLLLNGVEEQSASCSMPDPGVPGVPVSFGARYVGGSAQYVLDGALDEIKYFQYDPASYLNSAGDPFLMQEHGLYLRKTVLEDLGLTGSADLFKSPTFEATSRLRALVSGFYREAVFQCAPLDPLGPASPSGPIESGLVAYVHPNAPLSVVAAPEGLAMPNGCRTIELTPGSRYTNSLYDRIKNGRTSGYCASAAFILFGVYKAFGYPVRWFSVLNGPAFAYTDSHTTVDVYTMEADGFVLQDPTYNVSGRTAAGEYYGVPEISYFSVPRPAGNPTPIPEFTDGGYRVPNQRWAYVGAAFVTFFKGIYSFVPSWAY